MLRRVSFPEKSDKTLMESMGGKFAAAAALSVGSTPAASQNVAYLQLLLVNLENLRSDHICKRTHQSAKWINEFSLVPRSSSGMKPPDTNAFVRTPPSQSEYLPSHYRKMRPSRIIEELQQKGSSTDIQEGKNKLTSTKWKIVGVRSDIQRSPIITRKHN